MSTLNVECLEQRACPAVLTYHDGPILQPELTNVYVSNTLPWQGFDALGTVAATVYAALAAPYGVAPGSYLGSATVTNTVPTTDAAVQQLLSHEIATGTIPPPTANSCYMVCLPQNVTDSWAVHDSGYHGSFALPDGRAVVYGVVYVQPNAGVPYTHEVIEMATDPFHSAWYTSDNQECADLYNWQIVIVDGYQVSQFARPDGTPAVTTAVAAPITPAATDLLALAVARLYADVYGLLAQYDAAFLLPAQQEWTAIVHNPWHGTATGSTIEQQADLVFLSWLDQR